MCHILYDQSKDSILTNVAMKIGNKLNLNSEYFMDDNKLNSFMEEKDVGVIIDSKLSFDEHISSKVTKATNLVNLIRHFFEYLDRDMFQMLFTSIVKPHFRYAKSVWSPYLKKHIAAIENVQCRTSKLIPAMK